MAMRWHSFSLLLRALVLLTASQAVIADNENKEVVTTTRWPNGYVAICAVGRNQHRDVREWVEYHKFIGVGKIYLYDHNSTSPMANELVDCIGNGLVEYTYWRGAVYPRRRQKTFDQTTQAYVYNDCIRRFRERHHWIAFIDLDEFIVLHDPKLKNNINKLMPEFESFGGLGMNWMIFGSSGHIKRPKGGVLANYIRCLEPTNGQCQHVKVIANTQYSRNISPGNPHGMEYTIPNATTVTENFEPVNGPFSPTPSHKRVALYHYVIKSMEDYQEKMNRGAADEAAPPKPPEFAKAIDAESTHVCRKALPLSQLCCPSTLKPAQSTD